MSKAVYMIGADIPDGWEAIEYRTPRNGDFFLDVWSGEVKGPVEGFTSDTCRLIVRKIETWRPATPSDVKPGGVEARFRNHDHTAWIKGKLEGCRCEGKKFQFLDSRALWFNQCEVLDS